MRTLKELPYIIIIPILPILIGPEKTGSQQDFKYFSLQRKLEKQTKYLFVFLFIFFISYDIYYNNYCISKTFYLLPFALIYHFLFEFDDFLSEKIKKINFIQATLLGFIYYLKIIKITQKENGIIHYYFSNGYYCDIHTIENIFSKLHKNINNDT